MSDPGLSVRPRLRTGAQAKPPVGDYTCNHCGEECYDMYMVEDEVWKETGLPPRGGFFLHLTCIEEVLGRELTLDDLKDVPANSSIRFGHMMAQREKNRGT